MKRILLLFSAITLSCIALWAHDVEIDEIFYNLDETNKTAEVTYGGDYYDEEYSGSVTIPETITYNSEIYSVTSIGNWAFSDCSGLTSVTIPNSVTSIGSGAFSGCSELTSVSIGNSVTSIGEEAFSGCSGLTSVTIPNSVTSIGRYAFSGCSGLTSVSIGNSVTSIGYYAFEDCSGLTKVNYLGTVDKWVKIDFNDFWSNPTGRAKDLYLNNELLTDVKITTADSIKNYAFYNCQSIKSVEIGNSVTSIGYMAFSGCSSLTSVTIPNSVTSIASAFSGDSGLTSVIWNVKNYADFEYDITCTSPFYNIRSNITSFTFGNEVEHIPAYLCYGMKNLKEVTIGESVTSIGYYAFSGCSGLTSVIWNAKNYKDFSSYSSSPFYNIRSNITSFTFGNEVEHIPAYLCYYMNNLKEVTIGNSVTSIGSSAFSSCSGLTKVNYLGTVDKWGGEIDFKSSVSNPTYYAEDLYINNELLTDVKITTADSIKNYAFYNCQSIKSVEIDESVTSIGSYAFSGCSGLTSVSIPNSVTTIGSSAFYNCI